MIIQTRYKNVLIFSPSLFSDWLLSHHHCWLDDVDIKKNSYNSCNALLTCFIPWRNRASERVVKQLSCAISENGLRLNSWHT